MSVKKYTKKRKFDSTPEPKQGRNSIVSGFTFYVQKHDASHLHYDFRLELEGVLKSWAIPKGPSLDPSEKRLAIEVEDHPLEYGSFEGVIPDGNYGNGTVLLWDKGTFSYGTSQSKQEISEKEFIKAYDKGDLKFQLHGERLKGEFGLVRIREKKGKKSAQWLLIKKDDQFANSKKNILDQDTSVLSDRKLDDIADNSKMNALKLAKNVIEFDDYAKSDMPSSLQPMLTYWEKEIFSDEKWLYETKFDGYRAISTIDTDGNVDIYSRNGTSFNKDFESVYNDLAKLKSNIVVDGEIVVLNKKGRSDFSKIQQYKKKQEGELYYYVFDLLYFDGYDLTKAPLIDRKYLLQELLKESPKTIRYSAHVIGKGEYLFNKSKEKKWEGVIAKKINSTYHYGKRSHSWLKIKNVLQQEVIIVGFTKPHGKRKYFGSLELAVYNENNKLTSIGRVGTGFSNETLKDLYKKMKPLIQNDSPLEDDTESDKEVQFIKPELVCEIKFQEWTSSNKVRQAAFLGLRMDKTPKEVVKEKPEKSVKRSRAADHKTRDSADRPSDYIKKQKSDHREIKSNFIENENISDCGKYVKEDGDVKLSFTNLNKTYWPDDKIEKKDLINYYFKVSDYILPYLKGRPQSLKRNPDGVKSKGFFQKNMPKSIPEWLKTEKIDSESKNESINYLICDNRATLLYMANWGCIEINPWFSTIHSLDKPSYGVIDLDPHETDFDQVISVALKVKDVLDIAGIKGYPKTSGASGIHIYIPMDGQYDFEQSKNFAEILVRYINYLDPENTSLERKPSKRKGRVYLDYLQNSRGQTVASPYCLRPESGATVSTPLFWHELKVGALSPSMFTISTIFKRLDKIGDIFWPVIHERTDIEKALAKLKEHFDDNL